MENLFNCLCSLLLEKENRDRFLQGEGIQLMNLMLRLEIQIIVPVFGSGSVGSVCFWASGSGFRIWIRNPARNLREFALFLERRKSLGLARVVDPY
jgi:hypothetical protein